MLDISISTETGRPVAVQPAVLKSGGDVPVRITFSEKPGDNPVIELAISNQSSSPTILAFLDEFNEQNSKSFTGWLDLSDGRLMDHLSGKVEETMIVEIVVTVNGRQQRYPNLSLTVQRTLIDGPQSSDGGPVWVSVAIGDERYLRPDSPAPKIILTSPDDSKWEITISDNGELERTKLL